MRPDNDLLKAVYLAEYGDPRNGRRIIDYRRRRAERLAAMIARIEADLAIVAVRIRFYMSGMPNEEISQAIERARLVLVGGGKPEVALYRAINEVEFDV